MAALLSHSPRAQRELERGREIDRVLSILRQWGVHTLGQLALLPREELVARLGGMAAELWDRASGGRRRLLKLVSPPESFVESFEFEQEIETVEPLLFILRRFLQQLALRLSAIYLVAAELRLRLTFADKTHYERVFKIPQPTANEEVLFRMLHAHLENFSAAHPIVAVELEAQPNRPVRQQFGLFETALRDPAQLHETLARLIGLLGAERVGTPVRVETHQPDAFRMEPFVWEFRENNPAAEQAAAIPFRRFRKRKKATVLLEQAQPAHLRAEEIHGLALEKNGPFPLSGNWWDDQTWSRVEWDVALEGGAIVRCHQDQEGWAVDGIYD